MRIPKSKKKWGQNFLRDEEILKKIVKAAEIQPEDKVVEIGAGTGNLTFFLALQGGEVLALEKDRHLIIKLNQRLKRFKNVKIIQCDARFFDYDNLSDYKVVANLPYNITSFILRRLLTQTNQPKTLVLTMQKEVAEKIVAPAGSKKRGLLTILIQLVSSPKIIFYVSRDKFFPVPSVDAAVIKIIPQTKWTSRTEKLFKFVKIGFSAKRRQLKNNLKILFIGKEKLYNVFRTAKISPTARAEDLTVQQWKNLYEACQKTNTGAVDRQRSGSRTK